MQNPQIQAWLFPSDKTCDASGDLADGRHIDVLKPEYFTLSYDGKLQQLINGCNAYSASNVALVKQYSAQQFVTISGSPTGMNVLTLPENAQLRSAFLSTIVSFLDYNHFTGVEIDFEGFATWTDAQYTNYKNFLISLGNALHAHKYQLMIDGPAISDTTYQGYYPQWKWEDFNAMPQVDFLTVMAYDQMYDNGAGTPVSSLSWINSVCQWMLNRVTDHSKIVIGIPSYGYHGQTDKYTIIKDTYQQSTQLPGFSTATRDISSGEMMWSNAGVSYNYSDSITLQAKLSLILSTGIGCVSVWHLGGSNKWFNQVPQVMSTPTPIPVLSSSPAGVLITTDQIKAIAKLLSADQIAAIQQSIS